MKISDAKRKGNEAYWKNIPITNNPLGDGTAGKSKEWQLGWLDGGRRKIRYDAVDADVRKVCGDCANFVRVEGGVGLNGAVFVTECWRDPPVFAGRDGGVDRWVRPPRSKDDRACSSHARRGVKVKDG